MVKAVPRRGEIWICNFGTEIGTRPVAIVSADGLNEVREKVVVALGTTKKRGIPTEIAIGKDEGLSKEGIVSSSDLYTIPKDFLMRRTGNLNPDKVQKLNHTLKLSLSLL